MKHYMYKVIVESKYGVRTMFLCSNKEKLTKFINEHFNDDFSFAEITLSSHYCTDGNTEIHTRSLS